jgi:hypothetical protein
MSGIRSEHAHIDHKAQFRVMDEHIGCCVYSRSRAHMNTSNASKAAYWWVVVIWFAITPRSCRLMDDNRDEGYTSSWVEAALGYGCPGESSLFLMIPERTHPSCSTLDRSGGSGPAPPLLFLRSTLSLAGGSLDQAWGQKMNAQSARGAKALAPVKVTYSLGSVLVSSSGTTRDPPPTAVAASIRRALCPHSLTLTFTPSPPGHTKLSTFGNSAERKRGLRPPCPVSTPALLPFVSWLTESKAFGRETRPDITAAMCCRGER